MKKLFSLTLLQISMENLQTFFVKLAMSDLVGVQFGSTPLLIFHFLCHSSFFLVLFFVFVFRRSRSSGTQDPMMRIVSIDSTGVE